MQILDERLAKCDNMVQGTHKVSSNEEKPSCNRYSLGGFYSHTKYNHGWFAKAIHLPKINMIKFEGNNPITLILQMDEFFGLH